MFELRRLIEHCDLYAIKLMKFLYCSSSIAKLRRSLTFCFHPRFKWNFINFIAYIFTIYGFMIDPHNDQPPVGLIAQLLEHCTSIAEARVRVSFKPEFFRPFFPFYWSSIAKLWRSLTFVDFYFFIFFRLQRYQVSLEIRHLINQHFLVYHSNISPCDICICRRDQDSH